MKYGYTRVSTKGQLDGNSIEEQTTTIHNIYADAEIIVESYSGAKERPLVLTLVYPYFIGGGTPFSIC